MTANYDAYRTNANRAETILTPRTVGGKSFGKIASFPVDGQVYAQPLYATGVQIAGQGAKNVVYVATMNNTVYAIDADDPTATAPLWQVNLGTAVSSSVLLQFADIKPQVGILSTPAIDLARQVIYVVSETWESTLIPAFRLHALSLADGREMLNGPVVIAASVPGSGAGSQSGTVTFDAFWHIQRPGLALANGAVYVGFGSHADAGPYHGWLMAYDAADLRHQIAVFNTTPDGIGGAIWQSGRAPAVDDSGNIYAVSGNGDFDGETNFSGAVIKLSGSDLSVLDWYTPAAWQYLNANDLDVGSTGAVLVPGSSLLVTGDKGGRLIYLDSKGLGHIESAPQANAFKASPAGIFQISVWQSAQGTFLFQHDWNGPLKAYPMGAASVTAQPASQGYQTADSLYQGMVVSSNGGKDGILWETTGDRSQPGTPGTLHAFDASDLTQEIWNSETRPADSLGAFAKFATPLIANGRVYVPTFSNQLAIYGLTSSVTGPTPQITSLFNGASLIQGSVSPGEVVTILGNNIGPAAVQSLELDTTGRVTTELAGTQVFFDGIAAPLLYTSSTEVGAVVPFGVTGPQTKLAVEYSGQRTAETAFPVSAATPALFSISGSGTGQGAILNQDGSVNSATNPAPPGSVVALFATGLGPTTPGGQDGAITAGVLPIPDLPVSVRIGDAPAEILYAGGAPQLIDGVFQINARIPKSAPSGTSTPIVLQVGEATSPNGVTLAVQ